MTVHLYRLIDYFIPKNLKNDPYLYRKAKAFVFLFWFLFLLAYLLVLCNMAGMIENMPNVQLGLVLLLIFIWAFRKKGNLILFSNIYVGIYFSILAPSIPATGGIYSDNLHWLIVAPLIALLFANKISSFIWLIVVSVFSFFCYLNTENSPVEIVHTINKTPLFMSYLFFAMAIYGIVMIFEQGLDLIVEMLRGQKLQLEVQTNLLNDQKRLLEEQKLELKKQKELFEAQKEEILKKNSDLKSIEEKLTYSNVELENFAYAASHDLKEPLRMIGMYTQLTQRKLAGKLDESTTEFMFYITDGVRRMQNLLEDLLQYSRLGKKDDGVKVIDLNNILYLVIHNIMATLKETKACIISEPLPLTMASNSEMVQLFQNLIINSIKFRRKDVQAEIFISSKEIDNFYQFSFKDNGIGIKEEYKEKVFNIFERLHSKSEYEGSGIGLATVKKIVKNAGGQIWLESTEGVGTTFYFMLPKIKQNTAAMQNPESAQAA